MTATAAAGPAPSAGPASAAGCGLADEALGTDWLDLNDPEAAGSCLNRQAGTFRAALVQHIQNPLGPIECLFEINQLQIELPFDDAAGPGGELSGGAICCLPSRSEVCGVRSSQDRKGRRVFRFDPHIAEDFAELHSAMRFYHDVISALRSREAILQPTSRDLRHSAVADEEVTICVGCDHER